MEAMNEKTRDLPGWNNWLEDVMAGLLTNGVRIDEIKVQHYPGRTVVTVRGVPKYEWPRSERH
jgi:hypothetical protein